MGGPTPMNRNEKLMTPAKYPEISLGTARECQAVGRTLLATGIGPIARRKVENAAERVASGNSFASIVTKWLEHWQDGKSPRHVDSTRHRLKAIILPTLGFRPIAQFEAPERKREARDIAKRALESLRSENLLIPFLGLNTPAVDMLDQMFPCHACAPGR